MTLQERINYFESLFDDLTSTTSLSEKRDMVSCIPAELIEDFNYIIECLNGIRKFGYTYERYCGYMENLKFNTVKELLQYMREPYENHDLSSWNILKHEANTNEYEDFLAPIINRTLKLGIGRSLLEKVDTSPMLAKKYDPEKMFLKDRYGIFITQKLDGNRCIAKHDGTKWHFLSRSGREMHVDFDMTGLPTGYIYDGEILSPLQTWQSEHLFDDRQFNIDNTFNMTSGLINRHTKDKKLVYNIFDIIEPKKMYIERRDIIDHLDGFSNDIRILPLLAMDTEVNPNTLASMLIKVTNAGAEGLMINYGSATYENKRTDRLLKFKRLQTMDMEVVQVCEGTGKYEGFVGAIKCIADTSDGKHIEVYVGSGLSDEQRFEWAKNENDIIGKIVEIGYFEVSQNSGQRGTNNYSLRFPRLLKVRTDKDSTSEF